MTTPSPKEVPDLKQQLAAIEHERWADWQKWVHSLMVEHSDGKGEWVCLPADMVRRWNKQIETPYEQLSDREKAADMEQVDRYWPLIAQHIAEEKEKAVAHYREKITTGGRPLNAEPLVTKQPVPCPSCKTTHYYDWTLLPHQVYNSIIPGGVGHYCFPCFARKAIAEQVEAEKAALLKRLQAKGKHHLGVDDEGNYDFWGVTEDVIDDELAKLRREA